MTKYRKKPIVIDAIKWTGDFNEIVYNFVGIICGETNKSKLVIKTLEGNMTANLGDYIIRGINGEFYPCKADIFEKTYEKVEQTYD